MKEYYSESWSKVVEILESNIYSGLNEEQVNERKTLFGDNLIDLPYTRSNLQILFDLFKGKNIYFHILFIIFFILSKFYILGIISLIILLFYFGLKLYNDFSNKKEIELLQRLNTSQVLVLRNGVERLIEAENLVKGDIVYFRKNSFIGADIRIIESRNLKVDERNITGDNLLKNKYSIKMHEKPNSIGEINNILFRGSVIKEGSGSGIVIETGNNTQLGKVLSRVKNFKRRKNVIIDKFDNVLFKAQICLVLLQIILIEIFPGGLVNKLPLVANSFFAMLSILIPLIIIYYEKYIKNKFMTNYGIELMNYSSFGLLKEIKILFLKKLGTITKNELYVDKIYTNDQIYLANDVDIGDINIRRILDISILCNNAKYNVDNDWAKGDIFDIAYLKYGVTKSIYKSNIEGKNKRIFEIPKDINKKMTTTINKNRNGYRANVRGELDTVLNACTSILLNGVEKEITSEDIMKIKLVDLNFSKEGLITEAFAYRSFNYEPSESENIESNLVFAGIIAMENPIIDTIPDEINELRQKGVLPIIFTDDNKMAAQVLGKKINLISSEEQVTLGKELELLEKEEFLKRVSKTRIYCQLTQEQQYNLVTLYEEDGYNFAIEGESLAEVSLINLSKIGIFKGKVSEILKKLGDIYTHNSSIQAFLNLLKESKYVFEAIDRGTAIYVITLLSEIIFFSFNQLLNKNYIIEYYFIIFLNMLLLTPIILVNMIYGKYKTNDNKIILRGILFSLLPLILVYLKIKNIEVLSYSLISLMLFIDTIINCSVIKKGDYKGLKLIIFFVLLFILTTGILIFVKQYTYELMDLIILAIILFIFLISEIIIRKW
ncbi:cation-transporting P-type ATPase [Clostridium isatidis]|uniref:Uncharacterized protein n=1 Tax=Clostridium isatidis TaxID=182773 RepID=A0A343JDS8_9CLOT|nr:cation-transporting P-type ATPase [Clostridium isatidis]ASW43686.1 hypothetical protein BEN51_09390 [Clostridium isatidis]